MTDVSRETPFALGDAVRVKLIDGPTMSVADVDGNSVGCFWFDAAGHRQSSIFHATSLEPLATLDTEPQFAKAAPKRKTEATVK